MAQLLPPIPKEPIEPNSHVWREWFNSIRNAIVGTAQGVISWASLNFDGSNITDIVTRNHNNLQTIQGGTANQYYHLTATQLTNLGTVTTVSVATSNGFAGTVATATSTPVITLSTSITGLLKGNGTAISAATSGTDYAPATSGTSILYGNGSGGFSNVTIGSGVSFTTGTLSATGSGGTITSVTGTAPVASSGGTTPAISLNAGYGDTLNPYAAKTANYVLAGPTAGASAVPAFRALVAADIPSLTGTYVPYTGATADVDLDTFLLNAKAFHAKGVGGNGHLGLKHQSSTPSSTANESSIFADTNGNLGWLNGNKYLSTFSISGNTANKTYTFPNTTGTVALTSDLTSYLTSVSGTAGRVSSTGGTTPVIDLVSGIASAGTTGSASLIPVVTIDTYGRVTSITTAANPQGTVTSVAAITLGTTGTDLSSTVATGTTTPAITLQVPTASASNRGALSAADWTTFNNKGSGSVTSVAASVPAFLSVAGSPITASGTLAITLSGTALPVLNGGTGVTTSTGTGNTVLSAAPTLSGDVNLSTGNLVIGTSGKGIDFSATSGSGTSELLADYEEGTWTPTQGAGLTVVGTFSSAGTYTKVGRQVTLVGSLTGSTSISCTGAGSILTEGSPFTAANFATGAAVNTAVTSTSNILIGVTTIYIATAITSSGTIAFSITFFV